MAATGNTDLDVEGLHAHGREVGIASGCGLVHLIIAAQARNGAADEELLQNTRKENQKQDPRVSITTASKLAVAFIPTVSTSHNLYHP